MNKTTIRIFILSMLVISLSGCTPKSNNEEDSNLEVNSKYFEKVREVGKNLKEVRDPETGVHYYLSSWGTTSSLTPYFINENTVKVTKEDK